MAFYIDQSGKIEHTGQVTVIAFSNSKSKSIQIGAKEKQELIRLIRETDFPKKTFIYKIFSALVFLLLKSEATDSLIIDREYPGHEADIKLMIIQLFEREEENAPEISFTEIGKKAAAHKIALGVFNREIKPDIKVGTKELLEVIYGTKKCWRSRSSRDNL
ncbi:MAG: hypothetical protein M1484_00060 [Patescibacteria group bacterium]|nr:hypothetical protein [Patescibacteria group bacterium]MCL5431474.1 hypothetical protein [Patescibacteria group bacterium]